MPNINNTSGHDKRIAAKVVGILLVAVLAIVMCIAVIRITASDILPSVNKLTAPSQQSTIITSLFRHIALLGVYQYKDQGAPTYLVDQMNEINKISSLLDSLKQYTPDSSQLARIDSMYLLLNQRKQYFKKYYTLLNKYHTSDSILGKVEHMKNLIKIARPAIDSIRLVNNQNTKVIIDTIATPAPKQSFWHRLFNRRKEEEKIVRRKVQVHNNISVDTISPHAHFDTLTKISAQIAEIESDRQSNRKSILQHSNKIGYADATIINQLMQLLQTVEQAQLQQKITQYQSAQQAIYYGFIQTAWLLGGFVLCSILFLVLVLRDLARSRHFKNELVIARTRAEDAAIVKQRFLANMSHEIRTPLQTIIGLSEQMKIDSHSHPSDAHNIHQAAKHLLQTVNQILDYSRIAMGKLTIQYAPVNLLQLPAQVTDMLQVQAQAKGILLSFQHNLSGPVYILADEFRLKQVLINIIGNAIKFTEQGSVTVTLTYTATYQQSAVVTISIVDTGPGIAPQHIHNIFQEFEQADNSSVANGSGLGLAIVHHIISALNGTIDVLSNGSSGTEFLVTIPVTCTQPPTPAPASSPVLLPSGHIWIVDDDDAIRNLCSRILTRHHIPHTCFSSASALLAAPIPDTLSCVLMDIRLGHDSGSHLCQQLINAHSLPPHCRIIAFTAQALPEEQQQLIHQGFHHILHKPFSEHSLLSAIAHHPPVQAASSTLHFDAIIAMVGNNKEDFHFVISTFISQTELDYQQLVDAHNNQDVSAMVHVLHRLASRLGQLGAHNQAHDCSHLQLLLTSNQPIASLSPHIHLVIQHTQSVLSSLHHLLSLP